MWHLRAVQRCDNHAAVLWREPQLAQRLAEVIEAHRAQNRLVDRLFSKHVRILGQAQALEPAGAHAALPNAGWAKMTWRDLPQSPGPGAVANPAPRATAEVSLNIDGQSVTTTGEGNGPVNALDMAIRSDLRRYAPYLTDMRLVDFKVRILNTGTGAVTRVLIESADGGGYSWRTVGVSENIVAASFQALHESIVYKLMKEGVSPNPSDAD